MNSTVLPADTVNTNPVPRASWAHTLLLAVPALLTLALHITLYLPFIADDALISLRYAERGARPGFDLERR